MSAIPPLSGDRHPANGIIASDPQATSGRYLLRKGSGCRVMFSENDLGLGAN
jgi:hypothetical protein